MVESAEERSSQGSASMGDVHEVDRQVMESIVKRLEDARKRSSDGEADDRRYEAFLRQDFYTFIERSFRELNPETKFLHNWHIEKIAGELEKCRRGETTRLIINVPPRSLKSHCASIAFPAWLLGYKPAAKIIAVSYGEDLAEDNARKCRAFDDELLVPAVVPPHLAAHRQGRDFIIIDDPLKSDEALSDAGGTASSCRRDLRAQAG